MFINQLKRRLSKYLPILRPPMYGLAILLTLYFTSIIISHVSSFFSQNLITPKTLLSLFTQKDINIKTKNHNINFLVLGTAGADHAGPDLADTIIFVSLNTDTKKALLISIPRDLWVDSLKAKINTAYTYGEEKKPGGGFTLTKSSVKELLDVPIDYAVKIDFQGFVEAIDILGGVDIYVDRSFHDYNYPIPGKENDLCNDDPEFKCRYEHLHFDKGLQHMNGENALKYVRSRNAQDEEGTDFARSVRQQKVILAAKEKLFTLDTLLNPDKIKQLVKTFDQSIKTDIPQDQIDDFIRLGLNLKDLEIETFTLDAGDEEKGKDGLLIIPDPAEYQGHWTLVPKTSWQDIQDRIKQRVEDLKSN